jgi:hypothetical protein
MVFIVFQTNLLFITVYATVTLIDDYSLIVYFSNSVNRIIDFLIYFSFILYIPMNFISYQYYKNWRNNLSKASFEQSAAVESDQPSVPKN